MAAKKAPAKKVEVAPQQKLLQKYNQLNQVGK
jgi:hypothetical protein